MTSSSKGPDPGPSRVDFARWRSHAPSGGNTYDDELVPALRSLGFDLHEHEVTGPWPRPRPDDLRRLHGLLAARRNWLVDNIVGSAAPGAIRAARAAGGRVTLLLHYFPADDPALAPAGRERLAVSEAEAVRAANRVVVTSAWAAREVSSRYGRPDAVVALPGVAPAPAAPGSSPGGDPPTLLWLGRVTATKDPLTFVTALSRLRGLRWTARLVGPDTIDADLTRRVKDLIAATGLAGRVELAGAHSGSSLESVWAGTDLLVHTSRAETYGMVVSEALARGIPALVAAGTGAGEAQGVGSSFPAGDAAALADELRRWLADPELQLRWRAEAARLRPLQPTWQDTARAVAAALTAG